jgi:hypothetical protein
MLRAGSARRARSWSLRYWAGVEQVDVDQVAEGQATVEGDVDARRYRRPPERHVLVVGLEGGGPAGQEGFSGLGGRILGHLVGPVVVDLVVVEHDRPREGGVGGLQVGVALVLAVPVPVLDQGDRLAIALVLAGPAGHRSALVDVVADLDHQVEILACHVRWAV